MGYCWTRALPHHHNCVLQRRHGYPARIRCYRSKEFRQYVPNWGCLNPSPYVIPIDEVLICSFSSTDIRTWFSNVEQHATEGVNKILIGNKCDWEEKRAVSTEQGQALANELGIPFMEVSAKSNINVEKAFFSLASDIKKRIVDTQQPQQQQQSSVNVNGGQPAGGASKNCC